MTHFGFGEFAFLASVTDTAALIKVTEKVLKRVSSNVQTEKLGPVTISAGVALYESSLSASSWINRCRQACRLAKINGRGRVSSYIPPEKRRSLAIQLMLEIRKPPADFSGSRMLELIRDGAELNYQYQSDTPLMLAIKRNNKQAIRFLIQFDYDPNIQDKNGKTALMLALEYECDPIILDLLVSKRDLNPRVIEDEKGHTALMIALKLGYREIAKTLILLGSEPLLNEKIILNEWFTAAKKGDVDQITSMMDSMNFPLDMINDEDMTALMVACENGRSQLVKFLVEAGANLDVQGRRGYTTVMICCECGRVELFELLMEHGAAIQKRGEDGRTLVMCAAFHDEMAHVVSLCCDRLGAAVVDAQDMAGHTALMISAEQGSPKVATQLLRRQAGLDRVNKRGESALMIAARAGSTQIAGMLATLGAHLDLQTPEGRTALMYAASSGHAGIVTILIKHAVDRGLRDFNGFDAVAHAKQNGHQRLVEMIESGQLSEMEDLVEQLAIMQRREESLTKTMHNLTQMNASLADDINRMEIQKNKLQEQLVAKKGGGMFRKFTGGQQQDFQRL